MYEYRATVNRIVDGDTAVLTIDLGFNLAYTPKRGCRFLGYDAWERKDPGGPGATAFLAALCPVGSQVTVWSRAIDSFGRPLVVVKNAAGVAVAQEMVENGFGVPIPVVRQVEGLLAVKLVVEGPL